MPENFGLTAAAPLSIYSLLINLGVGVILSIFLRWHFKHFSSTLTNRSEFSHVCPFILLTTILIITVVKSSLALSLGLVGALSIVRFRTPIKEPEELAYLFIAIAMGLGLGADQTIPTIIAGPVILLIMGLFKWTQKDFHEKNLYLSIDLQNEAESSEQSLKKINELISKHVLVSDLRRVDSRNNNIEATYFIDVERPENLSLLIDELNNSFSGIGVTFIDQSRIPSS
jgi:hypothetical protein